MTNFDPSRSDAGSSSGFAMFGRLVLSIGAGIVLVFLAAAVVGYISVMNEQGDPDFRDFAIISVLVLAIGGIAYAILRLWRRMSLDELPATGPGEIRNRQRRRRHYLYLGFGGAVGGVIGAISGAFDQGDGSLFSGDWDKLVLDPAIAILLAVLLLFGFALLPLYGFRTIDEVKREHNLIGFTGGCTAVLAGFPIWAVLHAGGLGTAPHPFGIWMLAFGGMLIAFLYAKLRA